jgi:high-affinity nickel-transport protein
VPKPAQRKLPIPSNEANGLRPRVTAICAGLLIFNIGAWTWAVLAFRHYPLLLGTALVAYSFGLRHAVDADHIAAIDNVTRKLMQSGKRPAAVGLMFSLGHSTIVILGSMALAGAGVVLQHKMTVLKNAGAVVGTLVSMFFLFAIAMANLLMLRSTYRVFADVRRGLPYCEEDLDLLASPGLLSRLFRPMFRMISSSWHMYPLGLLFGLGFDTATEIGVLGISATEGARGLSFWAILVFPLLFAAGMSLVDTADNLLMLGAYGWAFVKPVRKLYYNMTITSISVLVAVVVGSIEGLSLLAGQFHLKGIIWNAAAKLSNDFGTLGYLIVGLFLVSWIVSIAVYKWRRFEDLEEASESVSAD